MQENKLQIYQAENGEIRLNVDLEKETIWLNLNQIAILFWRDKSTISRHIKNIFKSWELSQEQTVAKIATVQNEGWKTVTRNIEYYNLDVILSVWYRVDSKQATKFRIWANKVLKEYIIKWYSINERRLLEQKEKDFLKTIENLKALVKNKNIKADEGAYTFIT